MASVGVIVDFIVFALVLIICMAIGLFYSRSQKTTHEYTHGSRQMGLLPVSISLFVSFVSAMTMQGMPAEVYMYGIGVMFAMFALWGILLVSVTFLPIYYYMKPTSVFEYLEQRYNSKYPKLVACILSLCSKTIFSGLVIYGPSAGLESFSGIPTAYSIIIMAVVCTIYTSVGGLRGVIWTDVFQAFVMILGFCIVIIMGISQLGLSTIFDELEKHGRTSVNFSFDPTTRNSFWICLICNGCQWFVLFSLQIAMIRYTSLPTKKQAVMSVVIGGFGCIFLMFIACTVGAVIFAYYAKSGCDPLADGQIYTSNQVVPYFVVTVLNYPGIPGIFLGAIVSSSLSSISSIQNGFTAMLWNDILTPILPDIKDNKKALFMKLTVIVMGVLSVIIAFIAKHTGETLYNLGFIVLDVLLAPAFGMFILGAAFTFPSSIGALTGCIVSSALCLWISIGKMVHGTNWAPPELVDYNCTNIQTSNYSIYSSTSSPTVFIDTEEQLNSSDSLWIYSISSYANPTIGLFVTVIVGLLVSIIPAFRNKEEVNPNLLFPITRYILRLTKGKSYVVNEHKEDYDKTEIEKDNEKTLL